MQKKWKLCAWLFGINFFLSAFTFGGGYVVVPMVRKYFVRKKELFSEEELVEMAATAQSSPGAIAINLSALAGYRTAGAAGAAVSCVSAVLPPLLILSAVSVWYDAFASNPVVSAVLTGIQAGAAPCQLDFCLPAKFHLTYIDKDGSEKTPVVLHRAILGSLDRFMAYLIEETKGRFPTWLAPTQVKVLPVSEKTLDYARTVADKLTAAGVRVVLDESNEKIGYKIREAQQVDRVPYMLVLGAKEAEAGNISVRDRKGETTTQELDAFINNIVTEIKERRYN